MDSQHWLERFRAALKKRALPSWCVERLVRELQEHFDDMEVELSMDVNALLGNPDYVAENAAREFRSRTYFQRHPSTKRFAIAILLVGLLVVGRLFSAPASSLAGQYCVSTEIEDRDAKVFSAPNIFVQTNDIATIGIQRGAFTYQVDVKPGEMSEKAEHSVQLKCIATDAHGKETTTYAPRIHMTTGQTANMKMNGFGFHVRVAPRVLDK